MTTLPTLTRTIDDAFVSTWYEIRSEAIDNILDANPVSAALRAMGSFVTQVGGEYITRTLRYGKKTAQSVTKSGTLPQGEAELKTMARWTWRYFGSHAQRNAFDDQKNSGEFRIASLVQAELDSAREAMEEKLEDDLLGSETTDESGNDIQGLNDIVPAYANRATGTYGAVSRSNSWWQPKYKQITGPVEVTLVSDMTNLYNTITAHQQSPNLLIADQTLFELYEAFAMDKTQIVKDAAGSKLVDLGFEVLRFKGKMMIWSSNMTANNMLFLNTNYVEVVYDPQMWFDMTEWKPDLQTTMRLAHILSAMNTVSGQLRRHGRLYT